MTSVTEEEKVDTKSTDVPVNISYADGAYKTGVTKTVGDSVDVSQYGENLFFLLS